MGILFSVVVNFDFNYASHSFIHSLTRNERFVRYCFLFVLLSVYYSRKYNYCIDLYRCCTVVDGDGSSGVEVLTVGVGHCRSVAPKRAPRLCLWRWRPNTQVRSSLHVDDTLIGPTLRPPATCLLLMLTASLPACLLSPAALSLCHCLHWCWWWVREQQLATSQ